MADKIIENNQVSITGKIVTGFTFSHQVYGEGFYTMDLLVKRLSDSEDRIPVMVSERLVDVTQDYVGQYVEIHGQFRSYNRHEEKHNRLVLSAFARELKFLEEEDSLAPVNQIFLDGYICKPPVYRKTPLGREIANSVPETPIIMYNVPSRTGCNIQPATAVALAKNVKNIVGIKAASGDLSQIAKMMSMADGALELYSGNDDQVLPILSLGGLGVISVLSNVAPKNTHDMVMKFMEGDLAGAARLQLEAVPLINALFCEVNPIPVKTALNLMGWKVGPTRMPLCEMEPENEERLKKALVEYGIKLA